MTARVKTYLLSFYTICTIWLLFRPACSIIRKSIWKKIIKKGMIYYERKQKTVKRSTEGH